MSTKTQVQTQAKTPAAPVPARTIQPPVAVCERAADRPDIAVQLDGAARLGHSLGTISVRSDAPSLCQPSSLIQRQELPEEEEELQTKPAKGIQRQGGGEGFQLDDETAGRINRARGCGKPLDGALLRQMSASLGHDFSGVRVHTDAAADELNRQLSAAAFTTGPDIFFRRGDYNPGWSAGRELIAHELSHVVQQAQGRVKPTMQLKDGVPVNDDQELEHEADVMGTKALQMRRAERATFAPIAQATALKAQDRGATHASEVAGQAIAALEHKGRPHTLSSRVSGSAAQPVEAASAQPDRLAIRGPALFSRQQVAVRQCLAGDRALQTLFFPQGSGNSRDSSLGSPILRSGWQAIQRRKIDTNAVTEFKRDHPGAGALFKDIENGDLPESIILNRLLKNFYDRGEADFQYDSHKTPTDFWERAGDCRTLRDQFIDIAKSVYGITVKCGDLSNQQILIPGCRVAGGGNIMGNVDNKWWTFDNHHWAIWNGQQIDVLFGCWGVAYQKGEAKGMELKLPGLPPVYVKAGDKATHRLDNYTTNHKKKVNVQRRK